MVVTRKSDLRVFQVEPEGLIMECIHIVCGANNSKVSNNQQLHEKEPRLGVNMHSKNTLDVDTFSAFHSGMC